MRNFLAVAFLFLAAALIPAGSSALASDAQTVTVSGYGADMVEARLDATRNALQKVLKQLVVAETLIENDQIVRDSVLSTMNGFVDKFEIIGATQHERGVKIDARVIVSASRIKNYAGTPEAGSTGVDGDSMFAEASRIDAHRDNLSAMFAGLFRGFPAVGMQTEIERVGVSDDGGTALIDIAFGFNRKYLEALRSGLIELSDDKCLQKVNDWDIEVGEDNMISNIHFGQLNNELRCARTNRQAIWDDRRVMVCMLAVKRGDARDLECFVMPKATECRFCQRIPAGNGHRRMPPVVWSILPRAGDGALTSSRCLASPAVKQQGYSRFRRDVRYPVTQYANVILVDARMQSAHIELPLRRFNVAATKSLDIVTLPMHERTGVAEGYVNDVLKPVKTRGIERVRFSKEEVCHATQDFLAMRGAE